MENSIYRAGNGASRSAERILNYSHYAECPRIGLCSTTEILELPYNSDLQPAAIEFWKCLLLAKSTTISKLLYEKRSNLGYFVTEDRVALYRRTPKVKVYLFPEERGVYLDGFVVLATGDEVHLFDLKVEAHEVLKLTQTQQWQGVHTWLDWIVGDGIQLHRGARENLFKVGEFLGARAEYLEELKAEQAHISHGTRMQENSSAMLEQHGTGSPLARTPRTLEQSTASQPRESATSTVSMESSHKSVQAAANTLGCIQLG